MPRPHLLRKFSSIQKRIKLLYDSASKWEKDIAHILHKHAKSTMIDTKRIADTRETFTREEFETIVTLSKRDFLWKVSWF